jgi:hypothetical protein
MPSDGAVKSIPLRSRASHDGSFQFENEPIHALASAYAPQLAKEVPP